MQWLVQNWVWLAVAAFFAWMFMGHAGAGGHGGMGGCCGGGHQHGASEDAAPSSGVQTHEHAGH